MGPDPPENISIYLAGTEDSLAELCSQGKRITFRNIFGYLPTLKSSSGAQVLKNYGIPALK